MWYYEVASLESSCGIYGWWYRSSESYEVGMVVSVELRDKTTPVIVISRSSYPPDTIKPYKEILTRLTPHALLSEHKIELIRSLSRRMCISLSKVLSVFITKDILESFLSQWEDLPWLNIRPYHSAHLSEGIIHILAPGASLGAPPGVHIFPYFDTSMFGIDDLLASEWIDASTPARRRKSYHTIRSISSGTGYIAGDRHLIQYPIESFSDVYWYFPHLKTTLSHQLVDYRLLDILEMYRIYTGMRVHIVAYQLNSHLIALYHQKRFLLIDS